MAERSTHNRARSFEHYDRRSYPTLDVVDGYQRWAPVYDERMDPRLDLDLFARSDLVTRRIEEASVVDLACGTGRVGEWMRDHGAGAVTGVDLSPDMLNHAAERDCYTELVRADVTHTGLSDDEFDGAVTSMALCHVADLTAFFTEACRILKPGGWLFVVDFHPFFLMNGIPTHFDDPETGDPFAVRDHVHPVSEYFASARPWFDLVEMDERFIDEDWVADSPGFGKYLEWPVTIAFGFDAGRSVGRRDTRSDD